MITASEIFDKMYRAYQDGEAVTLSAAELQVVIKTLGWTPRAIFEKYDEDQRRHEERLNPKTA